MKLLAYYLPQYHETKENNEWWGKGFTEWVNLKKACSYGKGHIPSKQPINGYYYDLSKKETMLWQADLAEKNGVYGMVYYHYWMDGKMLLQTPAENLLKWKDVNQRFCFYWANHDWKKTWDGSYSMLAQQVYGGEKDWEAHFNYLLPFFKDDRYIKIDGKPVFIIYKMQDLIDHENFIKFMRNRCMENGLAGIYVIENVSFEHVSPYSNESDAVVIRQPDMARFTYLNSFKYRLIRRLFSKNKLQKISYTKLLKIGRRNFKQYAAKHPEKKCYLGTFTSWDNTTRYQEKGWITIGDSPKKFENELRYLNNIVSDDEFVFINAWNEWCEGMTLEPDNRFGYGYINAVKNIIKE